MNSIQKDSLISVQRILRNDWSMKLDDCRTRPLKKSIDLNKILKEKDLCFNHRVSWKMIGLPSSFSIWFTFEGKKERKSIYKRKSPWRFLHYQQCIMGDYFTVQRKLDTGKRIKPNRMIKRKTELLRENRTLVGRYQWVKKAWRES